MVSAAAATAADDPIIRDIVVEGGVTLTVDTVSYYLGLEAEDPLDSEYVTDGYRRLWDSGLFEEVRIEIEDHGDGTVTLYVVVKERPFVTTVDFEGNKKLKTSELKDKLDELGIEIPRNVPLKMAQLRRIEAAIKEVYDAEGFRSAQISFQVEDVSSNKRRVVYTIDEGGKVKISSIDFAGNEVFSDSKLRGVFKVTKQKSLRNMFGDKIVYTKEAWDEDRDNLRTFYGNRGYIDVKIGEPVIDLVAKNPDAETLKKKKYTMHITVPIEEGEPYTLGSFSVTGAEVFKTEGLQRIFAVKEGETYNRKAIDEGMEKVRDGYHNSGYVYAYTNETWARREGEERIVDVTVDIFEGESFRLGRLEFIGNTTTRDKVLRREFRISEGQYMNMAMFKASVFKVNALGYWKLEEEPLDFDFDDENKRVNVGVKGNEVGRNDVQFGAGYSELDGFFVQGQFNTRNFLGRGNTLGVSLFRSAGVPTCTRCHTPNRTSSIVASSSAGRSSRPASRRTNWDSRATNARPGALRYRPVSASAPLPRCPLCSPSRTTTRGSWSPTAASRAIRRRGMTGRSTSRLSTGRTSTAPSRPFPERPTP